MNPAEFIKLTEDFLDRAMLEAEKFDFNLNHLYNAQKICPECDENLIESILLYLDVSGAIQKISQGMTFYIRRRTIDDCATKDWSALKEKIVVKEKLVFSNKKRLEI